jgi:oxygen-independent coproporphyrinogen-3 oxidase
MRTLRNEKIASRCVVRDIERMPGVYISYPFCAQKCTYCNFASGVFPQALEKRYVEALRAELRNAKWPRTPETVYLGGGTPSQLDPAALESLLGEIPGRPPEEQKWAEATMEAAPGTITPEKAAAWKRAGINRVSLGVQSFIARELARTGRRHTAEIVEKELGVLRDAGISSINIDLIAGLPGQTLESWNASLDWLERCQVPHASVYMLEVDDDSRLGSEILLNGARYGAPDTPPDDAIADFYEIAVERLARAGLPRYEISNFARPGHESRHNLKYWRREPYLGFGADAHSFDGTWRWQNAESVSDYVENPGAEERTPADPVAERFFLGLRLSQGIEGQWSPFEEAIERFLREGLLEIAGSRLRLTSRGVLLSNEVFQEFVGMPVHAC